ncbi:MAG: DNA primase [Anaeroplasmataceae bacterium]|nr:DNA primase [Anaeroplasmataceae bacterium]
MATQEEITKIIESTDMVELVSPYVKLTKQGKNYKGLCPFHNEDTPSFVVSQDKHLAHCFGCGKGGNPIQFLMDIKLISFPEALTELAKKNGIELKDEYQPKTQKQDNTLYYEMMSTAAKFYHQNLTLTKSGKGALNYLYQRGIDDETIQTFQIGLAPATKDALYKVLKDANYLEINMMDLGLVDHNDQGYYDIFSRRITFPITDEQGHVVGFSARIFDNPDKTQPKYINTRDTFLYHKGNILYHLDQAKTEILRKKRCILHEGQMDVIASTFAGLKESICTMGTALTLDQAYVLKRYANQAIICYDGDKAGINASKKAIGIFKKAGMQVHLVLLPDGMDPDEYVHTYGEEEYVKYFESHILDELEYTFETAFLNVNLKDSFVVETVKTTVFEQIQNMPSQTAKEKYLELLANRINGSLNAILADYEVYTKTASPYQQPYEDTYEEEPIFLKPIEEEKKYRNYELRLFLYARNSKERALKIDKKLGDYIDAFSPINQDIWIQLVNNYYAMYEEFDDTLFCSLLTEEQKTTYLNNLDILRGSVEPYSDEDLECIIEKMKENHYKVLNQNLTKVIENTNDTEIKKSKLAEKFNNKKKSMLNRRK